MTAYKTLSLGVISRADTVFRNKNRQPVSKSNVPDHTADSLRMDLPSQIIVFRIQVPWVFAAYLTDQGQEALGGTAPLDDFPEIVIDPDKIQRPLLARKTQDPGQPVPPVVINQADKKIIIDKAS